MRSAHKRVELESQLADAEQLRDELSLERPKGKAEKARLPAFVARAAGRRRRPARL